MDVSIIIVNYNTKDLIKNCLHSIFKHTVGFEFEVIVVDNASNEGSRQMIKEEFPQITLIENEKNIGFGRANNLGVKKAHGKYLFFLNSDTILLNNAIKFFFEFFDTHSKNEFGAAGSILLDKDLKPTHSSGQFPSKQNILKVISLGYFDKTYLLNNYRKEKLNFDNESYFIVDYITGADLFIPYALFNTLNGFDPLYFMYYEEGDLQKYINELGLKCIIIDGPKIIHFEGGSNSIPIFSKQKRIMITKSMFLYFKKHSNRYSYILFRFCFSLIRLPILFDKRISFNDRIKYFTFLFSNKFNT